ncbi:Lar family restriction alleviation protein [Caproicibacterium sp. BJN0003]|uniref:Lar family restriction alleviation protein n=1 Tax=Caproicibacterium sp. BJN0003 TaxID=2994078 RepID=UPI0022565DBF|nr:Lar family restriction alleviation protein [Caproicibacterium sp. BJN0003]UZT82926.1 Lar family restriction alleviation protein [Caproicibacterium sp. BJN0003]
MGELKPCPLCGRKAVRRNFTVPCVNGWVGCQKCHCFINWVNDGEPEAIAAWNRRVDPENDNTEVLEALQKSQELSQMLLEKLKTKNGGGTNESNRNSPQD